MVPRSSARATAVSATAVTSKPPVRMAFLFTPNGVIPSAWEPKEVGANLHAAAHARAACRPSKAKCWC